MFVVRFSLLALLLQLSSLARFPNLCRLTPHSGAPNCVGYMFKS